MILLGVLMFLAGVLLLLTRRHVIVLLLGIELIVNAALLNFTAFGGPDTTQTNLFMAFIIVVAGAQAATAFAIVLRVFRDYGTLDIDKLTNLKD